MEFPFFGGKKKALTPNQVFNFGDDSRTFMKFVGTSADPLMTAAEIDRVISDLAPLNPWVSAAVRAILRNTIQPVLKVYNPTTGEDVDRADLLAPVMTPNAYQTYSEFIKYITFGRIVWGNAYGIGLRATSEGAIQGILPVPTASMTAKFSPERKTIEYVREIAGVKERISPANVMHWRDSDFGQSYLSGFGSLYHLAYPISNTNSSDRYNAATFRNGGEVKGVLTSDQPLTREDVATIRAELHENHGGADKMADTLILGSGMTYQRTGQSNLEMGFEILKKIGREEVLAVLKVPPVELGLTGDVNYATAESQRKLFWQTTMIPLMDELAEVLSRFLLKGTGFSYYFDYSSVPSLREDISGKLQNAVTMQMLGYSNDQIAEILDIPAPEGPGMYTVTPEPAPVMASTSTGIVKANMPHRDVVRMEFLKAHSATERGYKNALERWIIDQRNAVLDYIRNEAGKKSLVDDVVEMLESFLDRSNAQNINKVKGLSLKYFQQINAGMVKKQIEDFGLTWSDGIAAKTAIGAHVENIKDIQKTINEGLLNRVKAAIANGSMEGESAGTIADRVMSVVRDSFDIDKRRAQTIARTEVTSMANDLFLSNYEENGVEEIEWLSSMDELVRGPTSTLSPSPFNHRAMDGVKIKAGEKFRVPGSTVPIRCPGDPAGEAGNVINCRCTTIPVL